MTGPPSPKRQRTGEKTEDAAPAADAAAPVVDEKVQKVLDSIASVSEEIDAEEQKMNREIIKLEAKYNAAKRPFYEKRSKLLRDIPGFWKQALSNHPFIAASLSEGEAKVFESVEDLDVTFVDEAGGFKIELTFGENAYFGKGKLWKEITYKEDGEYEVKSSGVAWKDSKEATEGKEESIFFEWFASVDGDQSVAEHIKDDIWKNPVPYYLNEEDSDDDGEEGDDDEEDEDDEEEEAADEE